MPVHLGNGIDAYTIFPDGKSPSEPDNGFSNNVLSDYVLELRNVSYIRSFSTGRWYAKLFNPPVTAQFLKDVTLNVHGGEIMGIVGAGGCGKTTLLNVIARRTQGTTGGSIMFSHRSMTERMFQNTCAYVSFKQHLINQLSVQSTLQYQADLGLAQTLTKSEKAKRVKQMLRDFELLDQADHKVMNLTESAKRRLLVAMHAVRDPVMILIDEPSRGLDPLGAYQLMSTLSQYVRKYNRIAIVTMSVPRSDIYPLLDRLTILFFGEVMYSGPTKMMPQYFRSVGFPCPATENPAVYFLSLASVDRETSERYIETQDQAVKLIELFKADGEIYSCAAGQQPSANPNPYLPLCHLGRPNFVAKFFTLIRRNFAYLLAHWRLLLIRLFGIPILATTLFLFYFSIRISPTAPQTIAGLIYNCITLFSMVTAGINAASFCSLRTKYYQDSWDNLYGGGLFVSAYLFTPVLLDIFSIFSGAAIVYWGCKLVRNVISYLLFSCVLWCCCQFAQLHTMCIMMFIKSSYNAASATVGLLAIYLVAAGGFLKSIAAYQNSSSDWIHYLTHGSIYRYASAYLQHQQLINLTTGCTLANSRRQAGSPICRWELGLDYLNETYRQPDYEHPLMNIGICLVYVLSFTVFTIALYSLPMPHFVKRKFRYK